MRKITNVFGAALAALFLCAISHAEAGRVVKDEIMKFNPIAVYGTTVSFRTEGFNNMSAEIVATSATVANGTFTDGIPSSGIITVNSFAALSSATASGKITVTTNANTSTATISGGGLGLGNFSISNPAQWTTDPVSSSGTACSIASALNTYTMIIATCTWGQASGVVFTTAPYYGSSWNAFNIFASTPALTITTQLAGGQDNQSLTINGTTLLANRDFFPLTSNTVTGHSIATAIIKSSMTTNVTAGDSAGVISTSATIVGAIGNSYTVASSSNAALTLGPPSAITTQPMATGTMFGGANVAYTLNTSTIALTGSAFSTGLQVVYSTSSGVTITPLVYGTTYFAIAIPANSASASIMLSLTSTGAIAGLPIVLTSSATASGGDSFKLSPEAITGTPGVQWVVSNDNTNWVPFTTTPYNIAIPSVSYGTFFASGTLNTFDFGTMDYIYLGLNYKAPTTGGMNIVAHLGGKD
jgi:hypothetical protein